MLWRGKGGAPERVGGHKCIDSHGPLLWYRVGSAGDRLRPQI